MTARTRARPGARFMGCFWLSWAVEITDWAVLLTAATAAGGVDAVVGGGGLLVFPPQLLVAPGIAPQTALGTNKHYAVAGPRRPSTAP